MGETNYETLDKVTTVLLNLMKTNKQAIRVIIFACNIWTIFVNVLVINIREWDESAQKYSS